MFIHKPYDVDRLPQKNSIPPQYASFFPSLTASNRFAQYESYKAAWNLSENVDLNRTECDR